VYNFIASSNAADLIGANIWYVNIIKDNLVIDLNILEKELLKKTFKDSEGNLRMKKNLSRIKIICPTTSFGNSLDFEKLKKIKKRFNLKIVLDAAGSLGCEYDNKKLGQLDFDALILSFNANKLITTSAGGAIVVKNREIYKKMNLIVSNGRKNKSYLLSSKGYNYRMTNIQAAIGLANIENLNNIIFKKKKQFKIYASKIRSSNFIIKCNEGATKKSYWYPYLISRNVTKSNKLIKALKKIKVDVFIGWTFLNKYSYHKSFSSNMMLKKNYYKYVIPLPNHLNLNDKDIKTISKVVNSI